MSQSIHLISLAKGALTGLTHKGIASIFHERVSTELADESRPESEPFRHLSDHDDLWAACEEVGKMAEEGREQGSHSAFVEGAYLTVSFGYVNPEELVSTFTFSIPEQADAQAAEAAPAATLTPEPAPQPGGTTDQGATAQGMNDQGSAQGAADPADGQQNVQGQGGESSGAGASANFENESKDAPPAPAPAPAPQEAPQELNKPTDDTASGQGASDTSSSDTGSGSSGE